MEFPKLSIITITFNNYDELLQTLTSTEGIPHVERVVVNGGNCQKTAALLKKRTDILSVTERDKGISDAFNKGIKLATSDLVWLLNSGDILLDKTYPAQAIEQLQTCDFVYSNIELRVNNQTQILKPTPKNTLAWGMPFPHPSFVTKKSVYDEVGYYDLNIRIAMDLDLLCRILKQKRYVGFYIPTTSVMMDGNGISNSKPLQTTLETFHVLKRNHMLSAAELFSFGKLALFLLKKQLLRSKN